MTRQDSSVAKAERLVFVITDTPPTEAEIRATVKKLFDWGVVFSAGVTAILSVILHFSGVYPFSECPWWSGVAVGFVVAAIPFITHLIRMRVWLKKYLKKGEQK